jgi:uncharacterized protein (TIGR00106 family)
MAIVSISTSPLGTEGTGVSEYVAEALEVLERRAPELNLNYEVGAMFTTIEGDTDALFTVVREMHESLFEAGAPRVTTLIKVDDRRDEQASMQRKLTSVQSKLEHKKE